MSHALLEGLAGKGLAARGYATPAHALVMDAAERRLRNIPQEATQFSWAFPLSGVAEERTRDEIKPSSREEAFALFGGFIYLNENSMVVGVSALAKSKRGMLFDGPFPLSTPESALRDGAKLRSVLLNEARANHATIGEQLTLGVRNYSWIAPGESRGAEDGSAWEHGAFVFLYDETRTDLDCYFTVSKQMARGTVSGMRNTMFMSSRDMEKLNLGLGPEMGGARMRALTGGSSRLSGSRLSGVKSGKF